MCTIGAVFTKTGLIMFKNRDLDKVKNNPPPTVEENKRYKYIRFGVDERKDFSGIWAGMNEKGVGILGADGNSVLNFVGNIYFIIR